MAAPKRKSGFSIGEKAIRLQPTRLKQAEYERSIWAVTVDAGITIEHLMTPEFWAHVSAKFKPHDRIEIITEDGEYFAELLVIATSRLWARVSMLRFVELNSPDARNVDIQKGDPLDVFSFEFKGSIKQHCVIRKSDNEIVSEGHGSKADSINWAKDFIKASPQQAKQD